MDEDARFQDHDMGSIPGAHTAEEKNQVVLWPPHVHRGVRTPIEVGPTSVGDVLLLVNTEGIVTNVQWIFFLRQVVAKTDLELTVLPNMTLNL